jgi:hypothetical protein
MVYSKMVVIEMASEAFRTWREIHGMKTQEKSCDPLRTLDGDEPSQNDKGIHFVCVL